jgi:Tfp pilus assembly protein PilF/4-amino-4-deoxy-L-arabinose transferase-like glycosyltransferase
VFALALLVRLLHIWSLVDAPFFPLRIGDAADHHQLGLAAAAGDWLGGGEGGPTARTRRIFFHAPLYPYFLGVVYSLFGSSALGVRIIQAILGAASCVFVTQASGRLFTRREAIAAGVLLALYGPAIFYDTIFQDSVLDLFFASLSLWAIVEVVLTRRLPVLFAAGLALGGFNLTRENGIVLLVPLLLWLVVQRTLSPLRRAAGVALVLAGVVVALAPMSLRNAAITGQLVPGDRLRLAINLYHGNNPRADGYYRPLREGRGNPRFEMQDAIEVAERQAGRNLTLEEVSDYWLGETLDYVTTQPLDWLGLMARKTALAANTVEAADTEDLYSYAEYSPVLAVTGRVLGFGTLLALAALGVWVTWPQRRRLLMFYALPAVYLASVILFLVFGRYRHPVAPYLVLLGAPAVVGLRAFLRRPPTTVAAGLGAALAVLVFAHLPIGFSRAELRAHTHANVGAALEEREEPEAAARQYLKALEVDPRSAQANQFLGDLLRRSGRPDAALPYLVRAVNSDPTNARIRNDYGAALAALGRGPEAREQLLRAIALDPAATEAHLNLGILAFRSRGPAAAVGHYRRGVEIDPEDPNARRLLATALLLDGNLTEGLAHADTLAGVTPGSAARLVLTVAWELAAASPPNARRPTAALELLQNAPGYVPRGVGYHRAVAAAYAAAGRFDRAVESARHAQRILEAAEEDVIDGIRSSDLEADLERYRSGLPYPSSEP